MSQIQCPCVTLASEVHTHIHAGSQDWCGLYRISGVGVDYTGSQEKVWAYRGCLRMDWTKRNSGTLACPHSSVLTLLGSCHC